MQNMSICCTFSLARRGRCCSAGIACGFSKEASRCTIETLRNVALDVPFRPGPRLLYGFQGRMTAAARSEAVGVITKLRLVIRLQEGAYHVLQQLVGPRG